MKHYENGIADDNDPGVRYLVTPDFAECPDLGFETLEVAVLYSRAVDSETGGECRCPVYVPPWIDEGVHVVFDPTD